MHKFTYEELEIDFSIEQINLDTVGIINLTGKISHSNVKQVLTDIEGVVEEDIGNFLVVLSNLSFINSLGLALLLSLVRRAEEKNGKFVIGGYNPVLDMIIQLVEVSDKIRVFRSLEEAKLNW
jgi:anti-sigma B factor antagonist